MPASIPTDMDKQNRPTGPNIDARDARGGQIILKSKAARILFFGALILLGIVAIWGYTS